MTAHQTPTRRALVTGGSGDIGGAICQALAAIGMEVIVHAHGNLARAEAVVASIRERGGRAQALAFDPNGPDGLAMTRGGSCMVGGL